MHDGVNVSKGGVSKSIQQAVSYVSDGWLPTNLSVLKDIRRKLSNSEYKDNFDLLLDDLKSDISLYGYCLKELCRLVNHADAQVNGPKEMLRSYGIDRLSTLLESFEKNNTRHYLAKANRPCAQRFSECIISATTTEALAKAQSIDGDLAYSCAIFRQLGLTLIAWNYPHVYQRAISTSTSRFDLELGLSRVLGFSPTSLGLACAHEWKLPKVILEAMGDKSQVKNQVALSTGHTLEKICQIGELFAQITSCGLNKSDPSDWSKVKNEILKNLGPKGIETINKKIQATSKFYLKILPTLYSVPEIQEFSDNPNLARSAILFQNNPYISHLSRDIQDKMREFYDLLSPGSLAKECVEFLTNNIIPKAGFERGCVYLVDAGTTRLMPRLPVARGKLQEYEEINYATSANKKNFVVEAYAGNTVLTQRKLTLFGFRIKTLAASLGNIQKAGVLILEASNTLSEDTSRDPLVLFKAIHCALNDCLGLN